VKYKVLADVCQGLENTQSYLEKNRIIARLLNKTPPEKLEMVVPLLLGRIFPAHVSRETGIGLQQLKKAVGRSTGYSETEIDSMMRDMGDLGKVAEGLIEKKRQLTLSDDTLTVEMVFQNLRKLPDITGEGSVSRKISTVSKLLTVATPVEGKFIVRTVLGDLRIGVAEGRIRDSIAETFDVPAEIVEHAYMLTTDYGKVAEVASKVGEEGLIKMDLTVGHPVNPMLAQRTESVIEVLERMGGEAAFEIKLDGIRIQPHKEGEKVLLFTRRMEDYTHMFPDLEVPIRKSIKPEKAILDGELVAIDKDTGRPMPFQEVLRRRRKYDIEDVAKEIPVEVHFFDVLLSGEKTMVEKPYTRRREELERIVEPEDRVKVVDSRMLGDRKEIQRYRSEAISRGHEGLLAKNLNSEYRAGRREFAWLKIKADIETLDLVVLGAFAGKGDRAGLYGSYLLGAKCSETGNLKTVTRVGSGFTDEELESMTERFEKITVERKPENVESEIEPDYWFRPRKVFEINYEEIQESPSEAHTSGYGLRFPRYVTIREDLGTSSADTTSDIERLFEKQEKRSNQDV